MVRRLRGAAIPLASCEMPGIPVSSDQPPRGGALSSLVRQTRGVAAVPRTLRTAERWFLADPPDVVQTFLHHANVVATCAAARAKVPVRVGGIRVAQPRRLRWIVERGAVRRMHALVCVSQSVARFAHRRLWPGALPVEVIPNGVDVQRVTAAPARWPEHGLAADARVLLFLGRLDRQKGVDLLLDAAPQLLEIDPRVALVLVGEGPLAQEAEERLQRLPAGRARRLPWQSHIAPLLNGCELLLLPSRYEGMPNVVLEAMAAGRPVVAANVEGVGELLGDHARDQCFSVGSNAAMLSRVQRLLGDASLASQIGSANRLRAISEFSIAQMVAAYRQLYSRLSESPT